MSFKISLVPPHSKHYISEFPVAESTADSCCTKIYSCISKILSDCFKKQDSHLRSFYQERAEYNIHSPDGSDYSSEESEDLENTPLISSNNRTAYGTSLSTLVTLSRSHDEILISYEPKEEEEPESIDDFLGRFKELNACLGMKWLEINKHT